MITYCIVRNKTDSTYQRMDKRIIKKGLTLEEAQAHCRDPKTSSKTSKRKVYSPYFKVAHWFDSYTQE